MKKFFKQFFFYQFCNKFSPLLLCKRNVFDVWFFFRFFFKSWSTETLIDSNFWLWMYLAYILKNRYKKDCNSLGSLTNSIEEHVGRYLIWQSSGRLADSPWRTRWARSTMPIWEKQRTYRDTRVRLFCPIEICSKRMRCKVTSESRAEK